SGQNHGQVVAPGYQIRFNASSFRLLPEPVALFTIAHELAHVYRWALGKDPYEPKQESEAKTDAIAEGWGFDKKARDMLCFLYPLCKLRPACPPRAGTAGPARWHFGVEMDG
ncbi:MAG TPA: hypothetical protein VGZ47_18215, partial [Gemmataceae bacterium]|nr:hypothetical protein [Gemmataceae bacterium]